MKPSQVVIYTRPLSIDTALTPLQLILGTHPTRPSTGYGVTQAFPSKQEDTVNLIRFSTTLTTELYGLKLLTSTPLATTCQQLYVLKLDDYNAKTLDVWTTT
jgi:hypothetical protein